VVVRDGQIVIGDAMRLSLSFDHRIVDGHVGAAFAYEIINLLQDPDAAAGHRIHRGGGRCLHHRAVPRSARCTAAARRSA